MNIPTAPLSNLQLELLKIYAANIDESDLLEIKRFLGRFFMEKAIKKADAVWDEKGYTDKTMEEWLGE